MVIYELPRFLKARMIATQLGLLAAVAPVHWWLLFEAEVPFNALGLGFVPIAFLTGQK